MALILPSWELSLKENRGEPYAELEPLSARELEFYMGEFARIRQSFGTNLEEILAKGDTLGWQEVWRAIGIFTGWKYHHNLVISEAENMIEASFWIQAEVINGGLEQYFFNSAGDLWPFVMQVLIEGNDLEGIRIFQGVFSIFPDGKPSVDRGKRWEQLDQLREKDQNGMWAHFERYTDEYSKHMFPDEKTLVSVILARKSDIQLIWPT